MSTRVVLMTVTLALFSILSVGVAGADTPPDRTEVTTIAAWRAGSGPLDATEAAWRGELTDAAPPVIAVAGNAGATVTAAADPAVHPIWWAMAGAVLGALAALGARGLSGRRLPQQALAG